MTTIKFTELTLASRLTPGALMILSAWNALGKVVQLGGGMEVARNLPLSADAIGKIVSVRWIDSWKCPVFMVSFDAIDVEFHEFEIKWPHPSSMARAT